MMELLCNDLSILKRWKDALKDYHYIEVENITIEKNRKIIIADLPSVSKIVFNFLKSNTKHNIDFVLLESVPKIQTAKKVLNLGVKAYGNSYMLPIHLISCLETVKSEHIWVYPEFTYALINDISKKSQDTSTKSLESEINLTNRERQIVKEVINGLSNSLIANKLNISQQTVKVHLSHIFQKLHVSNRVELALYFSNM